MLLKASFGYCTKRFFRSGHTEKQVVNGGDEPGEFLSLLGCFFFRF
jgi:hypothetical protein